MADLGRRPERSPRRTLLVIASGFVLGALLTVVPLAALGLALMSTASETVRTMTREYQLSVAGDLGRTIESELGEAENGLEAVGRVLTDVELGESVAIQLAINLGPLTRPSTTSRCTQKTASSSTCSISPRRPRTFSRPSTRPVDRRWLTDRTHRHCIYRIR